VESEVDDIGHPFVMLRTKRPRRNLEKLREEFTAVVEPLAASLDVPVQWNGWDEEQKT